MNSFEKYANLIRKRAHEYSDIYNVDYSELESQGFLIYCECLQDFDISKSSFCTHLYIQLNRLADFAKIYKRQSGVLIQDYYNNSENDQADLEEKIPSIEYDLLSRNDFLKEARKELSTEAYELLIWILKREWEKKGRKIPNISMASKYFNKGRKVMKVIWNECETFWSVQGSMLYI